VESYPVDAVLATIGIFIGRKTVNFSVLLLCRSKIFSFFISHFGAISQYPLPQTGKTTPYIKTKNSIGTNLTAIFRCSCKSNSRLRWPCQEYIENTETRTGNIAIVAAAQVSAIPFHDLYSFFNAAGIPVCSKRHYLWLSEHWVWPVVEDAYYKQLMDVRNSLDEQGKFRFKK
jgi:hypothetical protein